MRTAPSSLTRRVVLGIFAAGAVARAVPQKGKRGMSPVSIHDDGRLQRFYAITAKYHADPVPAPLDRAAAIAFVNTNLNRTTPPDKVRKLERLAVFYDLRETAPAFNNLLTGGETQSEEIIRSALALNALAWIGDQSTQSRNQQYYHTLQDRANIELHRDIMLEDVEAFGPREGTAYHRQWVQGTIASLQRQLQQEQGSQNIPAAKNMQEKINALTEYLNLQLARVDRTFSLRQRIEAMDPANQVGPLVALSLGTTPESSPAFSYWASMRLLRLAVTVRERIGMEFLRQGNPSGPPANDLVHARALRAAAFFGQTLPAEDERWLSGQTDTGTDPLVLRPGYPPL